MRNRLRRRFSVGLDNVQPLRLHRILDGAGDVQRGLAQLRSGCHVQGPDVLDMIGWNNQRVTERRGVLREECDDRVEPRDDIRICASHDNGAKRTGMRFHPTPFATALLQRVVSRSSCLTYYAAWHRQISQPRQEPAMASPFVGLARGGIRRRCAYIQLSLVGNCLALSLISRRRWLSLRPYRSISSAYV